jgi:hypothetical protein
MDGQIYNFGSSFRFNACMGRYKTPSYHSERTVSGQIYSAAFLRNGSDDIFKPDSIPEKQFVASSMEDCKRVRREFIECIYDIF